MWSPKLPSVFFFNLLYTPVFYYFQSSDLAHSSIKGSSYHLNRTGTPNSFPANQPPGEMIWRKFQTSLPGFEGHDTIAVTFTFYDGVQGLDHPNPGMPSQGDTMYSLPTRNIGRKGSSETATQSLCSLPSLYYLLFVPRRNWKCFSK